MSVETAIRLSVLAVLIEAIVGAFKANTKWERITMSIGAVLCPLVRVDIFAALDMPVIVPNLEGLGGIIGAALTGVVISRGADYLLELWGRVTALEKSASSAAVKETITLPAGATAGFLPGAMETVEGYHAETQKGVDDT
jgi:hypothetical protein